jgi:DNA-binding transcriptional MerR regulator
MAPASLSISALAGRIGCSVPTIRYYEQIGLLPPAMRTSGGHRHYFESDLQRLQMIKRCRDFGFSIEQVRELAAMFENGAGHCVDIRDAVQAQLDSVRAKLDELRELESALAAFVGDCDRSCAGGANRDCCIVGDIAAKPAPAALGTSACSVTELRRQG